MKMRKALTLAIYPAVIEWIYVYCDSTYITPGIQRTIDDMFI